VPLESGGPVQLQTGMMEGRPRYNRPPFLDWPIRGARAPRMD
jgi:hypothetical protein